MENKLYEMIFKRKSFHTFKENTLKLTDDDYETIEKAFYSFEPLYSDIKIKLRIVKTEEIPFKKDAEACLLIYSEDKDNYLLNAGFIGEQLDLFLASKNIGACWFGLGKPDVKDFEGLKYVIMIAIAKADEESFRKDMFKAKRKELADIWSGDDLGIANIVRFAPSAVNSQPWFTEVSDKNLCVYRIRGKGLMASIAAIVTSYYNPIDIGIYLCFLELCLNNKNIKFRRSLYIDDLSKKDKIKIAEYHFD